MVTDYTVVAENDNDSRAVQMRLHDLQELLHPNNLKTFFTTIKKLASTWQAKDYENQYTHFSRRELVSFREIIYIYKGERKSFRGGCSENATYSTMGTSNDSNSYSKKRDWQIQQKYSMPELIYP